MLFLSSHSETWRLRNLPDLDEAVFSIFSALVGLEGVTFHTLRHTCASWLGQQGIGSLTIRDILGHTSIRTTDRYLHSQGQQLHQAVAALRSINR
jgi:integrase